MNRLERLFKDKPEGLLSVYYTAGYPAADDTVTVLRELQAAGVDSVEIGIPFSDPMADGPVIQQSGTQALNNGMTLAKLFEQLKDVRPQITMPLIMMGYLNPIMQYGVEKFCSDMKDIGLDGIIIPDLPYEDYITKYKPIGDKYGVKFIMLITPETSDERIRLIDRNTSGFIYMVSTAATTGARDSFSPETLDYFTRINGMGLRNPRLIGFGISNAATYRSAQQNANGAIVGSSFVKLLGSSPSVKEAVAALIKQLGE